MTVVSSDWMKKFSVFTHLHDGSSMLFQDKLLKAVEPYNEQLTAEEKERNQHSPCLLYTYDDQVAASHTYRSPCPGSTMFPDIVNCKSK